MLNLYAVGPSWPRGGWRSMVIEQGELRSRTPLEVNSVKSMLEWRVNRFFVVSTILMIKEILDVFDDLI